MKYPQPTCLAVHALAGADTPCILFQTSVPRRGAPIPFNPDAPRWRGIHFASAFEEDPDPEWQGYK